MSEFYHATKVLLELELIDGPYTWCNKYGLQHTKSKLDRVFVNHGWANKWTQVRPTLLFINSNDHDPLLELLPMEKGSKPLKFLNSWLH